MTDFRERYKRIGYGREDADMNRELRSQRRNEARHEMRNKQFNSHRDIDLDDDLELIHSPQQDQSKQNQIHDKTAAAIEGSKMRLRQLEQWQKQRNLQRIQEKQKVKPIFKVGVVHHRVYSPPLSKTQVQSPAQVRLCKLKEVRPEPMNKKVSKVTEKRLALKALTNKQKRENMRCKNEKNVKIKQENYNNIIKTNSPKFALDQSIDVCDKQSFNNIGKFHSMIKQNSFTDVSPDKQKLVAENLSLHDSVNEHTQTISYTNYPSKSELIKNKTLDESSGKTDCMDLDIPPVLFSPYVVSSRGKSSVRKELQLRRSCQVLDDIPTKDTVMQNLNISVADEERTAQYYKYILNKEIDSLNELCTTWNAVKENDSPPENIFYEIQAAVGQTQLLINKKFERFRSLVLDCETGKGEMLVTCKDLQGFWEMMYMEVENCNSRFNKLEEKKLRNWEEEVETTKNEEILQLKKKKPLLVKKCDVKKKSSAAKSSNLRAHILAARKKMVNIEDNSNIDINLETRETNVKVPNNQEEENRTTDNSKRRTSTPKTSNHWKTLLKKVQLSQTKKSTSPLVVMKLSQMCKTPEVQLNDSISYVNSDRTPAKSILKTTKHELMSSDSFKSLNKVFFKEESLEFLTSEQASEDSKEENTLTREPIERKLDFESDSFNLSLKKDEQNNGNDKANFSKLQVILSPLKSWNKKYPKIVVETSPNSKVLALEDTKITNYVNKKNYINSTKRQISFKITDENSPSTSKSTKRKKFSVPLTPRIKRQEKAMYDDESLHSEIENVQETLDNSFLQTLELSKGLNENLILTEQKLNAIACKPNTPNLRTRSSKISNDSSNKELDTTAKPKLRTKSLSASKNNSMINDNIQESPNIKLRRTKSLKITKNISDDHTKVSTPNLRVRRSRKVHLENIAPNEKETHHEVDEKIKLSRTPSLRKKELKEQHFNTDQSNHEADFMKINKAITPINRRKSLRLAHLNTRKEN